jgi:SAM-dependent methyltransferase
LVRDSAGPGEIPLEQIRQLNRSIRQGEWKTQLLNSQACLDRSEAEVILNLDRANWHTLTDLTPDSRILDLAGGLGTIPHALAKRYREVVAMEAVPEQVDFMKERFAQEGLRNIKLIQTSPWRIPFAPESFDLIVTNSLLERVAIGRTGNPKRLQQEALAKVSQLLRPGGYVYLGVGNRLFWRYFAGAPDTYCGLRYIPILPRRLANWSARKQGCEAGYRNYLYSSRGYDTLLRHAGFTSRKVYLAIPDHNAARFYVPLEENIFSYYSVNFDPVRSGVLEQAAHWVLARTHILKYLQTSSFAVLARKEF